MWGGITGTLSTQADLQTALGLKLDTTALATWAGSANLVSVGRLSTSGVQMMYLPPAPFTGSMAFGNGLPSLTNVIAGDGTANTAVGRDALLANTTGPGNTGVGAYALKVNTVGAGNTAVGANTLQNLNHATNNFGNTALGYQALANTTGGYENTGVGSQALIGNVTGVRNTACGEKALDGNEGDRNTGLGHRSGYLHHLGNDNVFVGAFCADGNVGLWAGSEHTLVGAYSCWNLDGSAGNTTLGFQAGLALTTGSHNVLLGRVAGANLTTGSQNIILGPVNAASVSADYQLSIGGVITATDYRTAPIVFANGLHSTKDAIAGVSTDGSVIQNTTASTAGVPLQQSPRLRFRSNVWNSTTPANNTNDWWIESIPQTGATPYGNLYFRSSLNGAASTIPLILNSLGDLSMLGNFNMAAAKQIIWDTRSVLSSPADGKVVARNQGNTAGIAVDVTTDAVLKLRNRATTGGAVLELLEQTAPVGFTDSVRIYAQDNGSGKTQLMAIFATGVAQQIAIQP